MCKEDLRLARKSYSRSLRVTTSTTSTQVLPYSPDRIAVTFSAHTAGRIYITNRRDSSPEEGLFVPANTQSVTFTYLSHPDFVRGPVFAQCPDGAIGFGIVESFLSESEYLT